jgi:hypothetical protein
MAMPSSPEARVKSSCTLRKSENTGFHPSLRDSWQIQQMLRDDLPLDLARAAID